MSYYFMWIFNCNFLIDVPFSYSFELWVITLSQTVRYLPILLGWSLQNTVFSLPCPSCTLGFPIKIHQNNQKVGGRKKMLVSGSCWQVLQWQWALESSSTGRGRNVFVMCVWSRWHFFSDMRTKKDL